MSYLQIKRFVDDQIKVLNTPVKIDENIRRLLHQENVPESQIQSVVFKCNLLIKRHNRTKFSKQVVHQIVQQMLKAEQANVATVNANLAKISRVAQPVMTDQFAGSGRMEDRIRLLNNLSDILPEGRYLFAVDDIDTSERAEKEAEKADTLPESNLVRDNEEQVQTAEEREVRRQHLQAVATEMETRMGTQKEQRAELRQKYDDLRSRLAGLNEELVYKMEKLAYLQELNHKMDVSIAGAVGRPGHECDSDGDGDFGDLGGEIGGQADENEALGAQISRFNVLVEKLQFALTPE